MLAGSIAGLLGCLAHGILIPFLMSGHSIDMMTWVTAITGFSFFGYLIFVIGLLLHALSLRGRADRIAELEAILRSRDEMR